MYIYIYIYIHTHIHLCLSLSLSLYIYIYIRPMTVIHTHILSRLLRITHRRNIRRKSNECRQIGGKRYALALLGR